MSKEICRIKLLILLLQHLTETAVNTISVKRFLKDENFVFSFKRCLLFWWREGETIRGGSWAGLGWAGLEGNLKLKPVPWQQQPHHYNTPYYISSYDLSSALHQIWINCYKCSSPGLRTLQSCKQFNLNSNAKCPLACQMSTGLTQLKLDIYIYKNMSIVFYLLGLLLAWS